MADSDRKTDDAAFNDRDDRFLHGSERRSAARQRRRRRNPPDGASAVPPGKDPAWRTPGWAPEFDAASLVDYLADVVLGHTRDAIMAGQKPEGGDQEPLSPKGQQGKRAAEGHRSSARGFTPRRNTFPRKIRRSKIQGATVRASGPVQQGKGAPRARNYPTRATVTIKPHSKHRLFVASDAKKGVSYFSTDGEVAKKIDKAIEVWLAAALQGETLIPDNTEKDADEV